MICYKDKTFCSSDCTNKDCHRFFSDEVREGARKWWDHDPDNVPTVSYTHLTLPTNREV